jgi:prepilin-type N-terminal cleavage/methylation domain-containing protein
MKKAFTLIELLVVIAIIAILAAILFPVFAQAKESAKAASDLSNTKQLGLAVAMYITDYDDVMPLSHGVAGTGQHGYNYHKYVPSDWAATPDTPLRVTFSQTFIMNTIQPYVKNYQIMEEPGMQLWKRPISHVGATAAGKKAYGTSYAYNGFLNGFGSSGINVVAQLPLWTESNGNRISYGGGFASPALFCNLTNFSPCVFVGQGSAGCVGGAYASATSHGGSGAMYQPFDSPNSSFWIYKKGQNWAFADSHAKFRRVGATLSPNDTDWRTDPFTGYNSIGNAGFYWYDGCHAWLFRPTYDFSI